MTSRESKQRKMDIEKDSISIRGRRKKGVLQSEDIKVEESRRRKEAKRKEGTKG